MTTREAFLGAVRREVERARPAFPATVTSRPAQAAEAAAAVRRQLAERWPEALARFEREFARVDGTFHRAATWGEVPTLVARLAAERRARRLVTWGAAWLGVDVAAALEAGGVAVDIAPEVTGASERAAHRRAAAGADLGVTGVDVAVAETGSLLLVSGRGRPRSTSLLPETHVAVFDRTRLVETLAQAGILLEALHAGGGVALDGAAMGLITGPSRTADIELTLNRGVHGPREVHAVFVET